MKIIASTSVSSLSERLTKTLTELGPGDILGPDC